MDRIIVELDRDPADGSRFYRARDEGTGREAESDHVPRLDDRDVHARTSLAAQAVARLGERIEAEA